MSSRPAVSARGPRSAYDANPRILEVFGGRDPVSKSGPCVEDRVSRVSRNNPQVYVTVQPNPGYSHLTIPRAKNSPIQSDDRFVAFTVREWRLQGK